MEQYAIPLITQCLKRLNRCHDEYGYHNRMTPPMDPDSVCKALEKELSKKSENKFHAPTRKD